MIGDGDLVIERMKEPYDVVRVLFDV